MRAKDIMTTPVVGVSPETTLLQAVTIMLERHISGLPVMDASGALVGIVSEADLLRRPEIGTRSRKPRWIELLMGEGRLAERYAHDHGRKVGEVMTGRVRTADELEDIDAVIAIMDRHRVKRLPVLCKGRVVGIITRADIIQALALRLKEEDKSPASDDSIRRRLDRELKRQPWAPVATLDIGVLDGVVSFRGTIVNHRAREALRVLAENVPGVREVHDHLAWIEPMSGVVVPSEEDARQAS